MISCIMISLTFSFFLSYQLKPPSLMQLDCEHESQHTAFCDHPGMYFYSIYTDKQDPRFCLGRAIWNWMCSGSAWINSLSMTSKLTASHRIYWRVCQLRFKRQFLQKLLSIHITNLYSIPGIRANSFKRTGPIPFRGFSSTPKLFFHYVK